jgi:hypothetical protein
LKNGGPFYGEGNGGSALDPCIEAISGALSQFAWTEEYKIAALYGAIDFLRAVQSLRQELPPEKLMLTGWNLEARN